MRKILALTFAVLCASSSCSFDLSVPEQPQRGRLLGTVDTQGHLPRAGQTVSLSSDDGTRLSQTTDDTGAFVFTDLPPGLFLVSVSLPGFAKLSSDLIRVRAGQDNDAGTLAPAWLQNTPSEGSIAGKVSAGGGGDVTGAKIEFLLAGTPIAQVTVQADGLFVQRLPPGTFTLRATHPSFITAMLMDVTIAPAEVKLLPTALVMNINPATLEGTVFKEVDGADTVPAEGADITLDTGPTTKADPAGHYRLTGLPAGQFQVRFTTAGAHDIVPTRPVTLKPGETTALDSVSLALDRGTITGTMKLADNGPSSGARVELSGTSYASLVSPDPADPSKGAFILSNIPVGTWPVSVRKDQYSSATASVIVTKDSVKDTGLLTLARLLGDFAIEDADSSNTPGYSRTLAVTLDLTGFPPTGVAGFRASEDPTFASFDGGFSPYGGKLQPFTLKNTEGAHTVYAQYTDVAGQVSQAFSANVVLDTIAPAAPQVSFASTGAAGSVKYTNRSQNLALQVSSSDGTGSGLSLMRVGEALDGLGTVDHPAEAYKLDTALTRASTADGVQLVYAQVFDHAGNSSLVRSDTVIVDTVAPTGSIALADGPKATDHGYTSTPFATVNETWADGDGGTVLIKLSNTSADLNAAVYGPSSASAGWFLNPAGEGLKTVYATFRDLAGNESQTPATASLTYDITAPSPAAAVVIGSTNVNSLAITLGLTTNPADLSSTQALTLSNEATFTSASTTTPAPFPSLGQALFTLPPGDGVRTVYVRFRDKAGNDAITSAQVTLDTEAPTGAFTLQGQLADGTPSAAITSSLSVAVKVTPSDATLYRLGDATMINCPASGYLPLVTSTLTNQTLSPTGVMTLCLRDAAGNTQGPLTQSIAVLTAAPTGCTVSLAGTKVDGSPAPAGKTAQASVSMSLTGCTGLPVEMVTTTAASITCTNAAGLNWQPYAAATTQTLIGPDGLFTVRGCVRDAARNVGSLVSGSISVDTTPPQAPALTLDTGAQYVNAAQVAARGGYSASATGTASGATEWALATTSAPSVFVPFTGAAQSFTFAAADATRTLYAAFRDDVGNVSASASASIIFDTVAPAITSASMALNAGGNGFTNQAALTVQIAAPADGARIQLATAASLAACAVNDFAAAPIRATQSTLPFTVSTGEGLKRVCAQFLDAAGNSSTILASTITLDTLAPASCALSLVGKKVDGTAAPTGRTGALSVTASIAACNEAPTSMVLSQSALTCTALASLPWVPFTASSGFVLSGPDGTNSVNGCVRDAAGNVSALTSGSITLDTTAPQAPGLSLDLGALYVNGAQVTARGGFIASATGSATGATEWALAETGLPTSFITLAGASNFTFAATEGAHTLRAIFRDDVGNASPTTSASITFDTLAPSVASASLALNPGGNGYTNSVSAVAQLSGVTATDAANILFSLAASPAACTSGDLLSPARTAFTTGAFVTLLPSGDGLKRLCVQVNDLAGNVSAIVSTGGTIVLDTTPPSAPVIVTQSRVVNSPDNTAFAVVTAAGVTETNFGRYDILGGKLSAWTLASAVRATTSFTFNLLSSSAYATGYDNVLKVRAVDLAGNTAESFVVVTTDIAAPSPVTLNTLWVSNGDQGATLAWDNSGAAADVVGYRVYYGTSSGSYTGLYAAAGPSPIFIADPSASRATLAGLPNGTQTFVTVRALDHAGNEAPAASFPSEVLLQPNVLSPNALGSSTLFSYGRRMVRSESTVYVMGLEPGCATTFIQAIDLSGLVSPMQGGIRRSPLPAMPTPSAPIIIAESGNCSYFEMFDLQIDGNHLFAATGNKVRIYRLAVTATPLLVATLDLGANYRAQSLQVRGATLFVAGWNSAASNAVTTAVDLTRLFDNAAGGPSLPTDQLGQATNGAWSSNPNSGLVWSRNMLVWSNADTSSYNVANVINRAAWGNGQLLAQGTPSLHDDYGKGTPVSSGNYVYVNDFYSGLSILPMNAVWSGAKTYAEVPYLSTVGAQGGWTPDIAGAQAFVTDTGTSSLRMFDLSDPTHPADLGTMRLLSGNTDGPAVHWGNYLIQLSGVQVNYFELATPQSPRLLSQISSGGDSLEVTPGFILAGGAVIDLHAGSTPTTLGSVAACSFSAAVVDEQLVRAMGGFMAVQNLENGTDRDTSTPMSGSDVYTVAMPPGTLARAVRALGNFLIVAEQRSDGTYVEVFDTRKIRDRVAATSFNPVTDSLGSLKVTGVKGALDLFIYRQRAFISIDDASGGVFAIDVRAALDDNPATGLTASALQGMAASSTAGRGAFTAAVSGTTLYLLGTDPSVGNQYSNSFETIDIAPALDEDPATLIASNPTRATVAMTGAALFVAGSYAYVAGPFNFSTLDVSSPYAPRLIAAVPVQTDTSSSCFNSSEARFIIPKPQLTVHGSRAYATGVRSTSVLQLE